MGSAFLFIALFVVLLRRYHWEKASCYQLGLTLYLPTTIGFTFLPREPLWVLFIGAAGSGVGTATVFLLPAIMLPDTIDDAELRSGEQHEGLLYSFFVFFTKLAAGMAILLSNLALEWAGYITSEEDDEDISQPPAVGTVLRVLMGPVTTAMVLLALLALRWYPITEATRRRTRAELDQLHAKEKEDPKTEDR
jgi:Na+/melibiose symporter-like transporter|eukprot:COSAG01_NODE_4612_length_4878_cov_15.581502_1_plen_193_part_00